MFSYCLNEISSHFDVCHRVAVGRFTVITHINRDHLTHERVKMKRGKIHRRISLEFSLVQRMLSLMIANWFGNRTDHAYDTTNRMYILGVRPLQSIFIVRDNQASFGISRCIRRIKDILCECDRFGRSKWAERKNHRDLAAEKISCPPTTCAAIGENRQEPLDVYHRAQEILRPTFDTDSSRIRREG